jgi:hypothetical protein
MQCCGQMMEQKCQRRSIDDMTIIENQRRTFLQKGERVEQRREHRIFQKTGRSLVEKGTSSCLRTLKLAFWQSLWYILYSTYR